MSSVLPNQKPPIDDEYEALLAMKWCWDMGIRIFPVVTPLPDDRTSSWRPAGMKSTDKVQICIQMGTKMKYGTETYDQNQKMWDKIAELYLHLYNKRKSG